MIKVNWYCPNCGTSNINTIKETESYAQFCENCGKEFYVDTDDTIVLARKVTEVEDYNIKEVEN